MAQDLWAYAALAGAAWVGLVATIVGCIVLKVLYNISPLHPLAKYPGPLLWRATRLCASYHHAAGTLYQRIAAFHEIYGETVRVAPDELSFANPDAWAGIFNSRPQLAKSKYMYGASGTAEVPQSMIMAPDDEHARLRRLATPAFLTAGVFEVEDVLQQYTEQLVDELREASEGGVAPQNMVAWYLWMLNDVIGQLAMGMEFECLAKHRMHPWPSFLMGALKQTAIATQFQRFGVKLEWLQAMMPREMRERLETFINTAIAATKQRVAQIDDDAASKTESGRRQDIIGMMMREMRNGEKLSVAELTANSILIVGGGAETTSTCLSATTYHLLKTPDVLRKLTTEIREAFAAPADITLRATAELPYLKACIDESLRIFPVASYIAPRVTPKGGHVVNGEVIPGGTYMTMGQWYMGRSEHVFEHAKDFSPERWLHPSVEAGGRRADEILRPFSLGPRNCIGKTLALAEIRLTLAKLLWHFDLALDGPQDSWVDDARFYVLWELQPLKVKLTPVKR